MAVDGNELMKILYKDWEFAPSDSSYALKKQCDRLSGMLHITMQALVDSGKEDFVLLQNDDLRTWWVERLAYMRKKEEAAIAKQRKSEIRAQVLARLTDEEKVALGIKKR